MTPDLNYSSCNHCGGERILTEEHIPPRSAGNDKEIESTTAESYLSDEETEFQEHFNGYTVKSLCGECNGRGDRAGTVKEFKRFRQNVIAQAEAAAEEGRDLLRSPTGAEIELSYDFMPNRFARQVIGMLLASQVDPNLVNHLGALRSIALAEEPIARELNPSPWRLGLSLINDVLGVMRTPVIQRTVYDTNLWLPAGADGRDDQLLIAILTPFVLTLTEGSKSVGTDISNWVQMGHSERIPKWRLSIALPNAWTVSPTLLAGFGYEP